MAKTIESVSFVESVRLCRIRGTRYVISRCTGHGSMDTRHCVARRWGEERGKPSFRRSLVDGRVRMPVGHRRCTRRKVTIGSGCRKLAGFASNGPCWYRVGYRAGRGGISGRSVAAQYDPTLRLYLTPPYVPYPPLFLSVQLSLFAIGRISNGRVSSNPANADLFDSHIDKGRNVMKNNTYGDVSFD